MTNIDPLISIESTDPQEFASKVSEAIHEGYELAGPTTETVTDGGREVIFVAFLKKKAPRITA